MSAPTALSPATTTAAGAVSARRAPEADGTAVRLFEIRLPEKELAAELCEAFRPLC